MKALERFFGKHSDIAMVLLVLGVLVVLFAPIPSPLLDFLILTNFSFAFLILLLTFYMARPVEFSTFPSLLLIATLFRLSLNVAATRLILSDGDAGRVIGAIGSYVVGGNYVIGLIVFLILIVVQYVVVTNGAQRISEVAARFTLDSMPGQQMSIDADLNMGFIDQAEAQRRRKNIEKEAGFYGAMDGASKFVKGDAIAGIIILLINIIGGLVIGVMQHKLPWDQALRTYSLLTIGDGIVTQVPALIIAVGTGIIVTRSASDGNLSQEVLRQITSFPKTLVLVGAALTGLLFFPGIPALPTLILIAAVGAVAWVVYRSKGAPPAEAAKATEDAQGADGLAETAKAEEDPYASLQVEPIEVHVGSQWAALVNQPGSVLMERIVTFRKQHAQDLGLVLPRVRFKDAVRLGADRYEIHLDGVICGRGEVRADKVLAIHPAGKMDGVPGEPTRDPTYGLPAMWIDEQHRAAAVAGKYTLVDAPTVFMTHLTEVLRRESATLLTRAEADRLLNRVRQQQSSLVEELIPTVLSVSDVQKVLQNLLREKVSIRHIEAILETLADAGRQSKDATYLTEMVRLRLGHAICQGLVGDANALHVITLDPAIESQLLQNIQSAQASARADEGAAPAPPFVLEPRLAEQIMVKLMQQAERMMKSNLLPVLLCAPELRRHVRALSKRMMPHLRVLSMAEVPHAIELKSYAVVSL
ncbi:flagellar biosynthesis protein FlhA [Acidovorax sp. GBBC 3334]|uniref:flagellar biosynthesis protein FlhA n=1 Tax=Acidovorax sp. GBBC 3334 TaxID=2940496 RepID=UPI002302621B|nr:flagellar biosynthesis protein FlhA [Acidovorax sp. GBBC 3334]MDA8456948.1 flagellar biosynthesis protein FlhA [Acidovorax sp. GBBC 3334]